MMVACSSGLHQMLILPSWGNLKIFIVAKPRFLKRNDGVKLLKNHSSFVERFFYRIPFIKNPNPTLPSAPVAAVADPHIQAIDESTQMPLVIFKWRAEMDVYRLKA